MSTQAILTECESVGIKVTPLDTGDLYVDPIAKLPDNLREKLVSNKSEIHAHLSARRRLHIHRVLTQLKDIRPYRVSHSLLWHGNPTPEQRQLLKQYESELIDALTPRALTDYEAEQIALFAHDNGETSRSLLHQVGRLPDNRVALLWIAQGSPDRA